MTYDWNDMPGYMTAPLFCGALHTPHCPRKVRGTWTAPGQARPERVFLRSED